MRYPHLRIPHGKMLHTSIMQYEHVVVAFCGILVLTIISTDNNKEETQKASVIFMFPF